MKHLNAAIPLSARAVFSVLASGSATAQVVLDQAGYSLSTLATISGAGGGDLTGITADPTTGTIYVGEAQTYPSDGTNVLEIAGFPAAPERSTWATLIAGLLSLHFFRRPNRLLVQP